ncbi:MAG: TIGR02452 family protein [Solobacterium sp.]|nr:TIGR02452 family protein [Solobacterium sp.]
MQELYFLLYHERSGHVIYNGQVCAGKAFRVDGGGILYGFEFRIVYADRSFFQIAVCSYDVCFSADPMERSVNESTPRYGGEYYVPFGITNTNAGTIEGYRAVVSTIEIADVHRFMERTDSDHFLQKVRISAFYELMNYIEHDSSLCRMTETMTERTRVYGEAFRSTKKPDRRPEILFREGTTLFLAKETAGTGKHTAVLNFANPVEPGGGILRGAGAQEESICRCSNLYKALISDNAGPYYEINRGIQSKNQYNSMFLGTDMVIYSPDATILKEPKYNDSSFEEYYSDPFTVDVITCAAPFFSGSGYILPDGDLMHLFKRRIRNIFETAIENEAEVLILGAFGCGAFHNPPEAAACAFREVLLQERYLHAFDKVVFAVKRSDLICPNIEAFEKYFSRFPALNNYGDEYRKRTERTKM